MRAPYITRVNMSRPTWSVPKDAPRTGGASAWNGWVALPASAG